MVREVLDWVARIRRKECDGLAPAGGVRRASVDVVGDVRIIKKPEVILDAQYTLYPLLKGREGKRTVGDEVDEGLNRG